MPHPVLLIWSCAHIPHFRFPTACRQCVPSSPVGKSHFMLTHAEFFYPKIPKTKRQSSGVSGQDRTTIQNSGFHWTSAECEYGPRDCRLQASPRSRRHFGARFTESKGARSRMYCFSVQDQRNVLDVLLCVFRIHHLRLHRGKCFVHYSV